VNESLILQNLLTVPFIMRIMRKTGNDLKRKCNKI